MTIEMQVIITLTRWSCVFVILLIILAIVEARADEAARKPQRCEYYEALQAMDKAGRVAGKTSCSTQDACRVFAKIEQPKRR